VLTKKKLDEISARIDPCTGGQDFKILSMNPHKTPEIVVYELQPHETADRVQSCNWILQCVHVSEVDIYFTYFGRYINRRAGIGVGTQSDINM
jgi:hypothetical protein